MRSSPVRDLAKRYAAGELSQENYRSQRRALIDAITSGAQALSYRDDDGQNGGHSGRLKLLGLAVAAVLVMAVVFTVAWKASSAHHDAPKAEPAAAAPAAPAPTPGPALVSGFVQASDWDDPSVDDFVHQWHGLTADEQHRARASLLYPRLESELRGQITSERAMQGASGPQGDPHLVHLQKMAQALGITDLR